MKPTDYKLMNPYMSSGMPTAYCKECFAILQPAEAWGPDKLGYYHCLKHENRDKMDYNESQETIK